LLTDVTQFKFSGYYSHALLNTGDRF